MKAIVTGMIATYPLGGVVWDYGQYARGLELLGFDVFYLEDTGGPTYEPVRREYGEDCSYSVSFLAESLAELSPKLGKQWHFRAADGRTFGMDPARMRAIAGQADLFLNISGGCLLRDEYMPCRRKILIDTDPGWNHFVNYPRWDAEPGWQGSNGFRAHDYFFTYAERIGRPGCTLPALGIDWQPTRPPVVLNHWGPEQPGERWTTVMTWNNFRRPIEHAGVIYGTKELEFSRIERLPRHTSAQLELAIGSSDAPVEHWRQLGWSVIDSHSVSRYAGDYRSYVSGSRGEFSVAKNLYVATRSGWFSCRSVCYLAAGRPVVLQDTGFSEIVPTGLGLVAFSDLDGAAGGINAIEANYAMHSEAARRLAHDYFASERVLADLLARVGLR